MKTFQQNTTALEKALMSLSKSSQELVREIQKKTVTIKKPGKTLLKEAVEHIVASSAKEVKPVKVAKEIKTQPREKLSPDTLKKLAANRDAYFKKMGYGKYKTERNEKHGITKSPVLVSKKTEKAPFSTKVSRSVSPKSAANKGEKYGVKK